MPDNPARRGSLLREPFLHFLLIGVALFALHRVVAPGEREISDARTIEIDTELLAALSAEQERRVGRPPTEAELSGAIQRWVDEEVLYREALALGLDRGDPIVRRRLVQKMTFLSEDLVAVELPDEADLQAWLDAHRDRYRRPERVTLEHIFVRREGPTDPAARAESLLAELRSGADPEALGDPFLRGRRFVERTRPGLDAVFGAGFADAVAEQPVGSWSEPLRSGYGLHLVRVEARRPAEDPSLDQVVDAIRRDWLAARQREANRDTMQRLRNGYDVRIVPGAVGGAEAALESSP